MRRADWVEIDFTYGKDEFGLHLDLGQEEAQKSHGLCRGGPDIANLPAGEIYYVPNDGSGRFPLTFEDGTIGLMTVKGGRIVDSKLLKGTKDHHDHKRKIQSDPATGEFEENWVSARSFSLFRVVTFKMRRCLVRCMSQLDAVIILAVISRRTSSRARRMRPMTISCLLTQNARDQCIAGAHAAKR